MVAGKATAAGQDISGCGWGYPYGWVSPSIYVTDYIPYYALHPPVYYSYPVARPYGYSPFAYPPGVMTPELPPPQAAILKNPFVPSGRGPAVTPNRVAAAPVRITNPYAVASEVPPKVREASVALGEGH